MIGNKTHHAGFTLVEMIVAIFIFSIVMVVATGALVSIMGANRKAQAVESIMNSVAFSVDSMTRALRVGQEFDCGGSTACDTQGADAISFVDVDGREIEYRLNTLEDRIERSVDGGAFLPLTAPNVIVERLRFYLDGESSSDGEQPRVLIVVGGRSGEGRAETVFNIQTLVTQRVLD